MNWKTLLSQSRLGNETAERKNRYRSEFQEDYDRIIFSSAFRRLQDKAQVFALSESDYVRTRLTHSLEVASAGRTMGEIIGGRICERERKEDSSFGYHPTDFGAIVAAACLAHDIGNPPFGHSGESAIQEWFATSSYLKRIDENGVYVRDWLTPEQQADITDYEGNAQGFRILSTLQWPHNHGGLQLTSATFGAMMKYPVAVHVSKTLREKYANQDEIPASIKKYGFFQSEAPLFEQVATNVGLLPRGASQWARHPLAFLVEAADDICYRVVDYQDAARLGFIDYTEVELALTHLLENSTSKKPLPIEQKLRVEILGCKAMVKLAEETVEVFMANEAKILSGDFDQALTNVIPSHSFLKQLRSSMEKHVYTEEAVVAVEAPGYHVLHHLLETFVMAVEDFRIDGKGRPLTKLLLKFVPEEFKKLSESSFYLRLMPILDFVSGMTDSYAVSLYKKLTGISLRQR